MGKAHSFKTLLMRFFLLLVIAIYLTSCASVKSSKYITNGLYVSDDKSSLLINNTSFEYKEGMKNVIAFRHSEGKIKPLVGIYYKLSSNNIDYDFFKIKLNSGNKGADSLKIKVIGLGENFSKYLDLRLTRSMDLEPIGISKLNTKLKKTSLLYDLYIAPKPLGILLDQRIDTDCIVLEEVVNFYDDLVELEIIFDQEKMFEELSYFSINNELLEYKNNTVIFRGKSFTLTK